MTTDEGIFDSWDDVLPECGYTINGQHRPEYSYIAFGFSTIGFSGCEVIAAYNAMVKIGHPESFFKIKEFFEKRLYNNWCDGSGWCALGYFGARPLDIECFLEDRGINYYTCDNLQACKEITTPGVFIISYLNTPITTGYHTIAISYDGNKYTAYNYDCDSSTPFCSYSLSNYMNGDWRYIRGFYIPFQ